MGLGLRCKGSFDETVMDVRQRHAIAISWLQTAYCRNPGKAPATAPKRSDGISITL